MWGPQCFAPSTSPQLSYWVNYFKYQQVGTLFVNTLVDALWYIDGNDKTLQERSLSRPQLLDSFKGYKLPEKHKHKKVCADSMKARDLHSHATALFNLLACGYMKSWCDSKRWFDYIKGLLVPYGCVKYTYTASKHHLTFIWKLPLPGDCSETELLNKNLKVRDERTVFQFIILVLCAKSLCIRLVLLHMLSQYFFVKLIDV